MFEHIGCVVPAAQAVTLSGEQASAVEALVSAGDLGEQLAFTNTGALALTGSVEKDFNGVIRKIREELIAQFVTCIDDYSVTGKQGHDRPTWLKRHLVQLVIMTVGMQWTLKMEEAFVALCSGGPADSLTSYHTLQNEMLHDLFILVREPLTRLHRQKACNLMICEVHNRDITAMLIQHGADRSDHFIWLGQMKTRWGRQTGGLDCVFHICDAVFYCGWDYGGPFRLLVITPLTDRFIITAMQCVRLHLGCAPQGPSGTAVRCSARS